MSQFEHLLAMVTRLTGGNVQQDGQRASLELDGRSYECFFDDNHQVLLLETVVAELDSELPPLRLGYICKRLLKAQFNFGECKDFTFGLTPDSHFIALQCLWRTDALSEQNFAESFDAFANMASLWEEKLACVHQNNTHGPVGVSDQMVAGMMRV